MHKTQSNVELRPFKKQHFHIWLDILCTDMAKKIILKNCLYFRRDDTKPLWIVFKLSPDEILSKLSNVYSTSFCSGTRTCSKSAFWRGNDKEMQNFFCTKHRRLSTYFYSRFFGPALMLLLLINNGVKSFLRENTWYI